jgi:hypothetical protein
MSHGKVLAFSVLTLALLSCASLGPAQVAIGIGVAPACPYGYFDYAPYDCAPYGYYGPDWFVGGLFIGAGPWFHGRAAFTATSTTALTRGTATMARCRNAARSGSTTSTATRRATATATLAR